MLQNLHIENIAVIQLADITFDSGLNVLTGETGAGKSIVIDSLNAVLGERVSRDLVRAGSDAAQVTALFTELSDITVQALAELGCEPDEDGALLIQRTITADGRGSCRINGRPLTASLLREAGRLLVNIHGQHDNQALLSPERHVTYLDRFGNHGMLLEQYRAAYARMSDLKRRLAQLNTDEAEKARRLDLLRFQVEEIENANPNEQEEEELLARRTMFRHAQTISDSLGEAQTLFFGGEDREGVLSQAERAADEMERAGKYLEAAEGLSQRAQNAVYELRECAEELRALIEEAQPDAQEQEAVEDRLDVLNRLKRKYGYTLAEVKAFYEQAKAELDTIENADALNEQLTAELAVARREAEELAQRLSEARHHTAEIFTAAVAEQLCFLDMPQVTMQTSFEPTELTAIGKEKIEFLMSANVGEPPRPLAKIASGGELSRIMLAIKSVLATADDIDTLIFDEIDTGISGRAAQKVGKKLRQTASSRQVLCVTHLAQIASQAHHHFLIEKQVKDQRTFTEIAGLDRQGQERELARMIGGEITPAALSAAQEMLDNI